MDRILAYHILKVSDDASNDDLHTAFEDAIFEEATFFMRRSFIPGLARVRMRNLKRLIEVSETLRLKAFANETQNFAESPVRIGGINSLPELLSHYHGQEVQIKQKLMQSENPLSITDCYQRWLDAFERYRNSYLKLFEENFDPLDKRLDENVSVAFQVDFNALIDELRDGNYKNMARLEYLRLRKCQM